MLQNFIFGWLSLNHKWIYCFIINFSECYKRTNSSWRGGRGPYPSTAFSESTLPGCYPVSFSKVSKTNLAPHCQNLVGVPALVYCYLDFLINTDCSLFAQEDIKNDLPMIWFEAETWGILVEKEFRLITS